MKRNKITPEILAPLRAVGLEKHPSMGLLFSAMDNKQLITSHQAYLEFVKAVDNGDTRLEQEGRNASDPRIEQTIPDNPLAFYYNCWAYEKRISQYRIIDAHGPLTHLTDHHTAEISHPQDRADAIKAMERRTLQFIQQRTELNERYDKNYTNELAARTERLTGFPNERYDPLYTARHQLANRYHKQYEDIYENLTKDLVQILDHGIEFSRQRPLETKRLFRGMARDREDDFER